MGETNGNKKVYPNQILRGKIKFKKLPDDVIIDFDPELKDGYLEKFLDDYKEIAILQPEEKNMDTIIRQKYNRSHSPSIWINRAKGISVNRLITEIEKDNRVKRARLVYIRPDLKHPNGFTFEDEVIIRVKKKVRKKEVIPLLKKAGLKEVRGKRGKIGRNYVRATVHNVKKQNVFDSIEMLNSSSFIKKASVNIKQLHSALLCDEPNDTHFPQQWNLENRGQELDDGSTGAIGADIKVLPAWEISKGSPLVVIAIIDTGCDPTHPDLLPNYVQEERWLNVTDGLSDDESGHGTCVAGVASAATNGLGPVGIAGVGRDCRIMPIKLTSDGIGVTETDLRSALEHARAKRANIINMSFSFDAGGIDDVLEDLVITHRIVLVAASGNSDVDFICYPASNANVIAVGATNENDVRCTGEDWAIGDGSNYGYSDDNTGLSVAAPGAFIWTTDRQGEYLGFNKMPSFIGWLPYGDPEGDYFARGEGTSLAAPHVSGLAGLMLSLNPNLSPVEVRNIMQENAYNPYHPDKTFLGYGRIDAGASLVDVTDSVQSDIYIRDSLTDTGDGSYLGYPLCYSPDIIVRQSEVVNPQDTFADITIDPGSDPVRIGSDNYIYIRVHNKTAPPSVDTPIHARIYYAPLSTTCAPEFWTYIGQIDFDNVVAGAHAVSDKLVWEEVPAPGTGHFCLIASIEGYGDPHPDRTGITSAAEYMQFIRDNNNICYRNLIFEDALPAGTLGFNFMMGGFAGDKSWFNLRIIREEAAAEAKVILQLPENVLKKSRVVLDKIKELPEKRIKNRRTFELDNAAAVEMKRIGLKNSRNFARMEINVPKNAEPGKDLKFVVQQVLDGEVLGDFVVNVRVKDPKKIKYIALRGEKLVHNVKCKVLAKKNRKNWIPFESLEDARKAGYDQAADCFKGNFTSKDLSDRLSKKVLRVINNIQLPEHLDKIAMAKAKRMKSKAVKGPGVKSAAKIIEYMDKKGRFTSLEQIEEIPGLDKDAFVRLVNVLK